MHPKHFREYIDDPRLIAAIADAEHKTHGKIYVYVSHRPITDALGQARIRFQKLGLSKLHEHRASVLIYLAPRTHKFAVIGDTAIHDRCGDEFWQRLADDLSRDLKAGQITEGLLNAIGTIKRALQKHFPA
jgi:uncharacterized membrane protein